MHEGDKTGEKKETRAKDHHVNDEGIDYEYDLFGILVRAPVCIEM